MRKDQVLYINNKDAWLTWSVFLIEDSYDNLMMPVSPKSYVENDFRSQPGKQILLRNYQPKDRNIQLVFGITCDSKVDYMQKFEALVNEMTGNIFEMAVVPLGTIYKVYLPEDCFLNLVTGTGFREGKLSVRVNEPNPSDRKKCNQ